MLVVEREDGDEHQQRPGHREQDELHGGVDAAAAAPDADHEVHRNQHRFPEHVEEEEIEADEDADHPRLEHEERHHELLHAVVDGVPGGRERDRCDERGEEHEQQADAVDADVIADTEPGNPAAVLHELIVRGATVEAEVERQREGERDERDRERAEAQRDLLPARHEEKDDGAGDGKERDGGENTDRHRVSRNETRATAPAAIVNA